MGLRTPAKARLVRMAAFILAVAVPMGLADLPVCAEERGGNVPQTPAPRGTADAPSAGTTDYAGGTPQSAAPGAVEGVQRGQRPVRSFVDAKGRDCRIYSRTIVIEGGPETAYATICRESSGRWVLTHP